VFEIPAPSPARARPAGPPWKGAVLAAEILGALAILLLPLAGGGVDTRAALGPAKGPLDLLLIRLTGKKIGRASQLSQHNLKTGNSVTTSWR